MPQPENRDGPPVFLPEPAERPGRAANETSAPDGPEVAPQAGRGTRIDRTAPAKKRRLPLLLIFAVLAATLFISAKEQTPIPFLIGSIIFVLIFRRRSR